jgi:hypothetical protein
MNQLYLQYHQLLFGNFVEAQIILLHLLVVLDQLLLDISDLDEPGIEGSIDKRGV